MVVKYLFSKIITILKLQKLYKKETGGSITRLLIFSHKNLSYTNNIKKKRIMNNPKIFTHF